MNTRNWLRGTSYIAYQAPDTPADPPEHIPAQGDPHGDEVLEGGPQDPPEVPEVPETAETPEAPEVATEIVADGTNSIPDKKQRPDWRDVDRSKLRDKLRDQREALESAEARARAAEALAESLSRQPATDPANPEAPPPAPRPAPAGRVYTQAELDTEADRRAQAIAQQTVFQNDFASAVASANKTYGKDKVNDAIARISELGGLDVDHLNLVLATDDPGKVIFDLGNKPEEFQRIMELSFAKRAVEFTKMGLKTETPGRKVSNAPPPVDPISGSGGSPDNRYNDKADDAAWFAAEEKRSQQNWEKKQKGWRG